ncbi:uncharacterized protein LOC121830905 [Peromyscus maniculatus bairdii]|uniref:uncharacterized protein LOC121830905 n=1 Tax=Peromyscus maniculatus bairdii TaxID=230844 RepID=UPI003FD2156F
MSVPSKQSLAAQAELAEHTLKLNHGSSLWKGRASVSQPFTHSDPSRVEGALAILHDRHLSRRDHARQEQKAAESPPLRTTPKSDYNKLQVRRPGTGRVTRAGWGRRQESVREAASQEGKPPSPQALLDHRPRLRAVAGTRTRGTGRGRGGRRRLEPSQTQPGAGGGSGGGRPEEPAAGYPARGVPGGRGAPAAPPTPRGDPALAAGRAERADGTKAPLLSRGRPEGHTQWTREPPPPPPPPPPPGPPPFPPAPARTRTRTRTHTRGTLTGLLRLIESVQGPRTAPKVGSGLRLCWRQRRRLRGSRFAAVAAM